MEATGIPFDWAHLQWHLDPVAIQLGPLAVRWYGLMYAFAFATSYALIARRLRRESWEFNREHLDGILIWIIAGVLLGGRLGYVLVYGFDHFLRNPKEILLPFTFEGGFRFTGISGMSFHGGLLGVAVAVTIYCRRYRINTLRFAEVLLPAVPWGFAWGRLGNFLNGELWGRPTTMPWGMYFPGDPAHDPLTGVLGPARHPSQLYQLAGEGILLGLLLLWARRVPLLRGRMISLYLIGYGSIRFVVEFFREPDAHIGFVLGTLSMGQVLCLGMILAGVLLWRLRAPAEAPGPVRPASVPRTPRKGVP